MVKAVGCIPVIRGIPPSGLYFLLDMLMSCIFNKDLIDLLMGFPDTTQLFSVAKTIKYP